MTRAFSQQQRPSARSRGESHPVPSHPVSYKTRLADRDARCVLSALYRELLRFSSATKEASTRVPQPAPQTRSRVDSRAVRGIFDREHARASGYDAAQLRRTCHTYIPIHTYVHAYLYIVNTRV